MPPCVGCGGKGRVGGTGREPDSVGLGADWCDAVGE